MSKCAKPVVVHNGLGTLLSIIEVHKRFGNADNTCDRSTFRDTVRDIQLCSRYCIFKYCRFMVSNTIQMYFSLDAYGKSLLHFSLAEKKTQVKPIHLPQFHFVGTSEIHERDEGILCS